MSRVGEGGEGEESCVSDIILASSVRLRVSVFLSLSSPRARNRFGKEEEEKRTLGSLLPFFLPGINCYSGTNKEKRKKKG